MADRRISLDRAGYGLLSRTLAECGRDAATGELRVSGRPGGAFHLRGGLVVAVESPGAPGPEALLLRSGRISGEQWDGLLREPGAGRWPETGLVAHGYAGAAQLRVVRMMALQNAVFAVVAGRVDGVGPLAEPSGSGPVAPVAIGESPLRLLQEATRKLTALAALPCPVLPDRERPLPAPGTDADDTRVPPARRELLTHADGRRTARDLAFTTGRGVYPVTVELARMLAEGLLRCEDTTTPAALPVPVRTPPSGALSPVRQDRPAPPEAAVRLDEPVPTAAPRPPQRPRKLPRREPGASGITETLAAKRDASWKGFFRLRHRLWSPDSGT
ncbi:MarR family transcriptional regulator [Streptomyces sp. KM273126]|uniref:MarR family transcriptional regulator n=1 Tax=Streptomyces sp. KM273126 TaxID=2545247 RepID=UPI00103C3D5A|nr:MarR family transcriptional regulator [Streptomyces sp. KM273126]MBA2808703.1 MarR family transcriptional regulator [Streptomyces sp. KM273126]